MNVSLSTELQNFVNERVKSGAFKSESDVIAEALRALQEREAAIAEEREHLGKALNSAIAQADRGECRDGEEVMARLRKKIQARMDAPAK